MTNIVSSKDSQSDLSSASFFGNQVEAQTITIDGAKYTAFTDIPLQHLINLLPKQLNVEEVTFLPDVCEGRSLIPTGTVVKTKDPNWRQFALVDCGCGMQLIRGNMTYAEFESQKHLWDKLGLEMKKNRGGLGDLGGGNHFLDALASYDDSEPVHFLVHTGSRLESGHVDHVVDQPGKFEEVFDDVVCWARNNRDAIAETIMKVYGSGLEVVSDLPHNTYEKPGDGSVIIRKGAIKVEPGTEIVLPSHMSGDVAILEATHKVDGSLFSLSHGTGRSMARGAAKDVPVDYEQLRKNIYIPEYIPNASLNTEAPHAYRPLGRAIELLGDLVNEKSRFAVVAYLGRL